MMVSDLDQRLTELEDRITQLEQRREKNDTP